MPGFVHFDIAADDPERAAGFYNRVFGWTITKLAGPTPYWLVTPTDGFGPGGRDRQARSALANRHSDDRCEICR